MKSGTLQCTLPLLPMLSLGQLYIGLQVAVAVLVIVLLYNLLFVAVDLRKILRRVDSVTRQLEDVIMRPISMADVIFNWIMEYIENDQKAKEKKQKKDKKSVKK
jgi:predicted Holliday junction resolvase-like endonuclease